MLLDPRVSSIVFNSSLASEGNRAHVTIDLSEYRDSSSFAPSDYKGLLGGADDCKGKLWAVSLGGVPVALISTNVVRQIPVRHLPSIYEIVFESIRTAN
jgi:hypothetical protein